jgi:DNA-directed RNA polymerase sigma subunit (sigma70/sigma32)
MPSNRLYRTIAFMLLFVAGVVSIAGAAVPQEGMQLWLRADAGIDLLNAEVVRWADQSGQMYERLRRLTRREKRVLELRYGLVDGVRKTQREVSRYLGISRSYVSRIEKRAINKLQESLLPDGTQG